MERAENDDLAGAIADYTKVIELAPDSWCCTCLFQSGLAKAKLGDGEGANTDCAYAKSLGL
jgi:hypothetical protein